MTEARSGQVVTFYSFEGGTGRTMALANVAWILAANGRRVLVADWDLESPGLHRFFHPFLPPEVVRDSPGVIDLIREYTSAVRKAARRVDAAVDVADYARVQPYAVSLDWTFPDGGTLDFMSSGWQNDDYTVGVGSLDWDNFYSRLGGGDLLKALRAEMKNTYDYVLIDSRTGLSDLSDICTGHLPDTLVDCFTFSTQGIEGSAHVARKVADLGPRDRRIRVLPVPMRVENAEKKKVEAARNLARALFAGLPDGLDTEQRTEYWGRVEIPYQPFYAFEETLAVFADDAPGPLTLLGAYQRLTEQISRGAVTALPPMDARERERCRDSFERRASGRVEEVWLDHEPEDEVWAEWIERIVVEAGIRVSPPPPADGAGPREGRPDTAATALAVVSQAYRDARRGGRGPSAGATGARRPASVRALYIADLRPLDRLAGVDAAHLAGVQPVEAMERITRLLGVNPLSPRSLAELAGCSPDGAPKVCKLPTRNAEFTGRADDLRALRAALRAGDTAAGPSAKAVRVVVSGMGGVGKTQLALEYAHRHGSQYDVIWWIQAGQPQFVDAALVDLARELTDRLEASVGVHTGIPVGEIAQNVLRALGRGEPTRRWLLVFDNAEDPDHVRAFLPAGGAGHVIVTSRDRMWGQEEASLLELNVFKREESVAHLERRARRPIAHHLAARVAERLGDLPLAVATTGAWLAETGRSAEELLAHLEQHGTRAVPGGPFEQDGPAAAWSLSLDQLDSRSGSAYRLLQLCSIMSPDGIALELVYSSEMAAALTVLGPEPVDHSDMHRVVQDLNRFALVKLDLTDRQLQIHRLLQDTVLRRMTTDGAEHIRREVHRLLDAWTPDGDPDEPSTWSRYRMLWPHLNQERIRTVDSESEKVRDLQIDRVRYQWVRGDLEGALETARFAESAWTAAIAADPGGRDTSVRRQQLLRLRFNKANALRFSARLEEACALDRAVLAEQKELLGPLHRQTLMTAGGLAADLRALGRYRESLELAHDTYGIWLEVFGSDFRRTVDAAGDLAVSLRLAGDFERARELDESVFEWRSRVLTATHGRTLSSANCVALDLRESGRYEEAVGRLREHLDTARFAAEPDARVTLQLQVNLAASLRAVGRFAEAGPLLAEARERLSAEFADHDADLLICRLGLANNLLSADDPSGADRELVALLADLCCPGGLGSAHPLALLAANSRVAALRALGADAEALEAARETTRLLGEALGVQHPHTLAAATNLAVCLAESGFLAESRELDARTVAALAALLGTGHPDVLRARANLALTRIDLGEPGAAEELHLAATELGLLIGRGHPTVVALYCGRRAHRLLDGLPS